MYIAKEIDYEYFFFAFRVKDAKQGLYVKTIDGVLSILEIQGENAKKMSINDFLRGNQIDEFQIFE